jgi:hypothetical protein
MKPILPGIDQNHGPKNFQTHHDDVWFMWMVIIIGGLQVGSQSDKHNRLNDLIQDHLENNFTGDAFCGQTKPPIQVTRIKPGTRHDTDSIDQIDLPINHFFIHTLSIE